MGDDRSPQQPRSDESEWRRQQRLAEVFGNVLPDTTRDEQEPAPPTEDDAQDRWLRSQVPPHHT